MTVAICEMNRFNHDSQEWIAFVERGSSNDDSYWTFLEAIKINTMVLSEVDEWMRMKFTLLYKGRRGRISPCILTGSTSYALDSGKTPYASLRVVEFQGVFTRFYGFVREILLMKSHICGAGMHSRSIELLVAEWGCMHFYIPYPCN